MSVFTKVKKLNLPLGEYAVFGSGLLEVLHIRKVDDIDLAISKEIFDRFKKEGWEQSPKSNEILVKEPFEAFYKFTSKNYNPNVPKLIKEAVIINGVPFVRLEEIIKFKKSFGRPKDLVDLKLIEKYLKYRK